MGAIATPEQGEMLKGQGTMPSAEAVLERIMVPPAESCQEPAQRFEPYNPDLQGVGETAGTLPDQPTESTASFTEQHTPAMTEKLKSWGKNTLLAAKRSRVGMLATGTAASLALLASMPASASGESNASDQPVTAPGAAVTNATASDLQQDCVKAALRKPKRKNEAVMIFPGDRRKQEVSVFARLNPVSETCSPLIARETPKVFIKVQNPRNHKKWFRSKTKLLEHNNLPIDGNGGQGGSAWFSKYNGDKNKKLLYRCTPGKGVTRVQSVYRLKVNSAIDGHTLGTKSYRVFVRIDPVDKINPVLGGGVRRAC
ncbi:MAG TPA: hypothetical protein VFX86_03905 [Candidatus Saccharimonadales bacterium]|nr:hypothetical protein [Candidatus Saccharimonadales bacterium]